MKEHNEDAIKNWEVKMAETTLQQCLAALCNAGDSAVLKNLGDHSRTFLVSMIRKRTKWIDGK